MCHGVDMTEKQASILGGAALTSTANPELETELGDSEATRPFAALSTDMTSVDNSGVDVSTSVGGDDSLPVEGASSLAAGFLVDVGGGDDCDQPTRPMLVKDKLEIGSSDDGDCELTTLTVDVAAQEGALPNLPTGPVDLADLAESTDVVDLAGHTGGTDLDADTGPAGDPGAGSAEASSNLDSREDAAQGGMVSALGPQALSLQSGLAPDDRFDMPEPAAEAEPQVLSVEAEPNVDLSDVDDADEATRLIASEDANGIGEALDGGHDGALAVDRVVPSADTGVDTSVGKGADVDAGVDVAEDVDADTGVDDGVDSSAAEPSAQPGHSLADGGRSPDSPLPHAGGPSQLVDVQAKSAGGPDDAVADIDSGDRDSAESDSGDTGSGDTDPGVREAADKDSVDTDSADTADTVDEASTDPANGQKNVATGPITGVVDLVDRLDASQIEAEPLAPTKKLTKRSGEPAPKLADEQGVLPKPQRRSKASQKLAAGEARKTLPQRPSPRGGEAGLRGVGGQTNAKTDTAEDVVSPVTVPIEDLEPWEGPPWTSASAEVTDKTWLGKPRAITASGKKAKKRKHPPHMKTLSWTCWWSAFWSVVIPPLGMLLGLCALIFVNFRRKRGRGLAWTGFILGALLTFIGAMVIGYLLGWKDELTSPVVGYVVEHLRRYLDPLFADFVAKRLG